MPPTLAMMGVHHEPQFPLRRVFGPVARTEVQDDFPTREDRGGAVAIFIAHFAEVLFPKFFTVEIIAKDTGRAVPDHHARAVGDGS